MRPCCVIMAVAVLAVGNARGQEPAASAPLGETASASAANVSGASNSQPARPSLGTRLANWRPISRWLTRTSATQTRVAIPPPALPAEPIPDQPVLDPIPGEPIPDQPAPGVGGFPPTVTPANPFDADPGTTPPGAGGGAAATAGGTEVTNPGSVPISANPAATNIIAGTGALGRALGFDAESGIRIGGMWIGGTSGTLSMTSGHPHLD